MQLFILNFLVLLLWVKAFPLSENIENNALVDAEFNGKFEGDMLLSEGQRLALNGTGRNGLRNSTAKWPDNVVVFHIEEDDFEDEQIKMIEEGMADIANKSCIKFRKRKNDMEHSVIIQGSEGGCFSNVGFNLSEDQNDETNQVLNLARGCFRHGTVVHEMLHTLGFYHMQSTHDRDEYVKIYWDNILPSTWHNFKKYDNDTVTDFGVSYDYGSVMHYPKTAFSKNGNKTIEPLQKNVKIGQRNGLSESDILKLNRMYCEENNNNPIQENTENEIDQVNIIHRIN